MWEREKRVRKKPELLAPAGDLEKLHAAIDFGADAVYCGGPMMQLRAQPTRLPLETLAEGAEYVHARGKKLYVTVNAFARNEEIPALPAYLRELHALGADAVIVSDPGVLTVAREHVPELEVHISTQASCLNYAAANAYYKLGARRVILGRELSLEEIRVLRDNTPPELELEVFVHGAMCMAYSGRCLISAFLAGRDSNRGDCAQPCRWRFHLLDEQRPGEYYPIDETENGTTILSSRDLCTLEFLDEIAAAGIDSFKIEGRMKSPYYVATVVNAYRRAMDGGYSTDALMCELYSASHRSFSSGFFMGELKNAPPAPDGYTQECVFVAVVTGEQDGLYTLEQRNRFRRGETLEVLSPHSFGERFVVETLLDETGMPVEVAPHPQQRLRLACPVKLHAGDLLRRRDL